MRKKGKVLTLALILALVGIIVSGTVAYYTNSETAHNIITTGGVDIELVETNAEGEPWETVTGVLPGMEIDKRVSVEAADDCAEAWVRVKVSVEVLDKEGNPLPNEGVVVNYLTEHGWTEKEGYWYYKNPVKTGEATETLFDTVTFGENLDNRYQKAKATVTVKAQAVQSKNNGTSALEAAGWPED